MNNPDAALAELDRAIDDLGATGVQIFTNVNGRPLDRPEYQSIFASMAERRLPIWMHPARPATVADYAGEPRSKYETTQAEQTKAIRTSWMSSWIVLVQGVLVAAW